MSPLAIAATPLVGGAAIAGLACAIAYKNPKTSFPKTIASYLGGFCIGVVPVLNVLILITPECLKLSDSDDISTNTGFAAGYCAGLITCYYSAPEALKMALLNAGVLKTVTHTTTTTSTEWA
jgi:hypothetical protein